MERDLERRTCTARRGAAAGQGFEPRADTQILAKPLGGYFTQETRSAEVNVDPEAIEGLPGRNVPYEGNPRWRKALVN